MNRFEARWVSPQDLLGPLTEIELKFAPKALNIAGPIGLPLAHPRVAIVGTRTPSLDGLRTAKETASFLAKQGVTVISGLARGIDTAAHVSTIEAGGVTVAVLGTPLARAYPKENAQLQAVIMRNHLAVSQFSTAHTTNAKDFVFRNRTMALMGDASVIVESGNTGGSLHQGWEAIRLGRPLFIHANEYSKPWLTWPKKMASYGAVEFREPADLLDLLPTVGLGFEATAVDSA